jgi:hypothetical protein
MGIEQPVERLAIFVLMYVGGIVLGATVLWLVAGAIRDSRRRVNRARGAERPPWAPGIWHCASCLSTNDPVARRCRSCLQPRHELAVAPVEVPADVVPDRIEVSPGVIVTLRHESRAHVDPADPHWRVTVGGQTVGSASGREGVRALLRALVGAELVHLDVRGEGLAAFRLTDLVARFDGPRFPLDVACPEGATWSAAG